MNSINIILPTQQQLLNISKTFMIFWKISPEYFYDFISKISFKGSFPYCIWSCEEQDKIFRTKEEIISFLLFAKENNNAIYFDFSNTKLENLHFYDRYTNYFLSLTKDMETYAIVANLELGKYIKEHFPHIKLVDKNSIFDIQIADKKSTIQNYEKTIMYLNSYCNNCEVCINEKSIKKLNFEQINIIKCQNITDSFENSKTNEFFISLENLKEYVRKGIRNFIIKEQTFDKYEYIESCLYYLVKPEFHNIVRLKMLKTNHQNMI